MRELVFAAALAAALPGAAVAQLYGQSAGREELGPGETRSTYDWRSGSRYTTERNYDGTYTVRGSNLREGSRWRTEIQQDGTMRGTDADGNRWRYDATTGVYRNLGTGVTCRGEGRRRRCY